MGQKNEQHVINTGFLFVCEGVAGHWNGQITKQTDDEGDEKREYRHFVRIYSKLGVEVVDVNIYEYPSVAGPHPPL